VATDPVAIRPNDKLVIPGRHNKALYILPKGDSYFTYIQSPLQCLRGCLHDPFAVRWGILLCDSCNLNFRGFWHCDLQAQRTGNGSPSPHQSFHHPDQLSHHPSIATNTFSITAHVRPHPPSVETPAVPRLFPRKSHPKIGPSDASPPHPLQGVAILLREQGIPSPPAWFRAWESGHGYNSAWCLECYAAQADQGFPRRQNKRKDQTLLRHLLCYHHRRSGKTTGRQQCGIRLRRCWPVVR